MLKSSATTNFFTGLCVFKRAQFAPQEDGIAIGPSKDDIRQIICTREWRPIHPAPYWIGLIESNS